MSRKSVLYALSIIPTGTTPMNQTPPEPPPKVPKNPGPSAEGIGTRVKTPRQDIPRPNYEEPLSFILSDESTLAEDELKQAEPPVEKDNTTG